MDRSPVFQKQGETADFVRNIWCPYYSICLNEAAHMSELLDCSGCDYFSDLSNLNAFLQFDF